MRTSHESKALFMPTGNKDPYVAGQEIVKIIVIALLFLLIGDRFGVPISWLGLICAIISAVIFYLVFRLIWRLAMRWRE
jgi:NhaP-type Na+/H+ or K+/H+ antiporter